MLYKLYIFYSYAKKIIDVNLVVWYQYFLPVKNKNLMVVNQTVFVSSASVICVSATNILLYAK